MKRFATALLLLAAACDRGGVVNDNTKPTPPLNQMVESPGDWSAMTPAIGRTPNESGILSQGPLVTDLGALLGKDAADFRERMTRMGGPLKLDGPYLASVTPPGEGAAYLIVDTADHSLAAGRKTVEGWVEVRTPGSDIVDPPGVTALKAAP